MSGELCLNATSHFNPAGEHRWAQECFAVDMGPAATRLDQESHTELPEKTRDLCESWRWTLRTYAKMNWTELNWTLLENSSHDARGVKTRYNNKIIKHNNIKQWLIQYNHNDWDWILLGLIVKWTTCQMLVFVVTVTVSVFLDNENYKLLLIIPCRIEHMA